MTRDDYSHGWEHRARATELQDIAAMDRLAAELAAIDQTDKVMATEKLLQHLKQG